jgi:hypothetical protein
MMKVSEFVDELETLLDQDLQSLGGGTGTGTLYDNYAHYYEKRGGTPFLIIDAEHAGTRHGMEMKSVFGQFELLECPIQDIYESLVRKPVLKRIVEIEQGLGNHEPWHAEFDGTAEKERLSELDETEEEEQQAFLRDNT